MPAKLLRPLKPSDTRDALKRLGLTVEQAARRFGASPRAVQYWTNERDNRSPPLAIAALIRLTVHGRVDLDELGDA